MGNLDRAVEHFEDAVAFCRKGGYRPTLAWSCYDYADLLLSRNGPSDRQQARFLLDEVLSISSELGMRPLMERVVALKDKVESQPRRGNRPIAPTYPDGLTEREVEVLRRIAAGKTDREIAEELFISVRTVTTHVSNILNKTSTANRTEAATYTARHGLA
jgi:DNA-binding CsgD family transcriptional regulator